MATSERDVLLYEPMAAAAPTTADLIPKVVQRLNGLTPLQLTGYKINSASRNTYAQVAQKNLTAFTLAELPIMIGATPGGRPVYDWQDKTSPKFAAYQRALELGSHHTVSCGIQFLCRLYAPQLAAVNNDWAQI